MTPHPDPTPPAPATPAPAPRDGTLRLPGRGGETAALLGLHRSSDPECFAALEWIEGGEQDEAAGVLRDPKTGSWSHTGGLLAKAQLIRYDVPARSKRGTLALTDRGRLVLHWLRGFLSLFDHRDPVRAAVAVAESLGSGREAESARTPHSGSRASVKASTPEAPADAQEASPCN